MNRLVGYFDTARLINLPSRPDRLRLATKELQRVGISLGTTGIHLYAAETFTDRGKFPGNAGVRGCFHSHLECILEAKRQGKKSILIIEDDIALSSSIDRLTPSIIAQLDSKPWDMVYFGYLSDVNNRIANARTSDIRMVETDSDITTCHFYAVNGRIYTRLLDHLDRIASGAEGDQKCGPMPIDGAYNVFRDTNPDIRTLLAIPKIGWQRPSRSDITPGLIDSFRILQPLVEIYRRIKDSVRR